MPGDMLGKAAPGGGDLGGAIDPQREGSDGSTSGEDGAATARRQNALSDSAL